MNRFSTTFCKVLLIAWSLSATTASAQEYQKAKDVLKAITTNTIFLYESASLTSKKVAQIPGGASVLVYGKQGSFLDVKYISARGFGYASAFAVQGVAGPQPKPEPSSKLPSTISTLLRKRTDNENGVLPIRLNPYLTYVGKGKSFYEQFRLGFEGTYDLSKDIAIGGVLDLVTFKGTYFDIGPIFKRQYDTPLAILNPAISFGLLYYKFNHNTDSDEGLGFQWAIQNDIPLVTEKAFQPAISLKIGADMMFFYFDRVRIPYFVSVGAVFRF